MSFPAVIGCSENSTDAFLPLESQGCNLLYDFFSYYKLTFGIIGLLVHAYIIFSYNFRKDEPFIPTQLLILGTAVFDMICCCGLILLFIAEKNPNVSISVSCAVYFAFAAFDENSVYLMILLMSANRYYTICRPVRQYVKTFSTQRVKIYISLIFLFSVTSASLNHVNFCLLAKKLAIESFEDTFRIGTLSFYILFFGSVLIVITITYLKICLTLLEQIRGDEIMNSLCVAKGRKKFGPLDDDLEMEKSYLKAIVIFSSVSIPLLLIQFVTQVRSRLGIISSGPELPDAVDPFNFTTGNVVLGLFSSLFLLNPLIFYLTNEEFKVKLKRPLRALRAFVFLTPEKDYYSTIMARG